MDLTYRLLNVFTDGKDPFTGNGVAVFEDGSGLSTDQMQTLASQVNIETVFILPRSNGEERAVRFFSPEKETGFAGSASLATAAVVRELQGGEGDVQLHVEADADDEGRSSVAERRGAHEDIDLPDSYTVFQRDDLWILDAYEPKAEPLTASPQILASLVGLNTDALGGDVMTVNHGRGGIVLPVRTVEDVRKTRLDARMLHSYAMLLNTEPRVYVWANSEKEEDTIVSRMFYGPRGGVLEVAATGTGGVNLGSWLAAHGARGIRRRVIQGRPAGRRSLLDLRIDDEGEVYVGGRVAEVARGTFTV
ncbi:putative PhzF superfamily epimerase YddE/YHI9 [Kineosphaera limosa]|uniref:Phenazine biosynthesis PhzC/PhzF family protein n=1 Tax=Kineosphaera limosa NBRC 100340 TaxID=1184609 RepID=K6WZ02_9MICO|nr:PhzF family phenazine biosynthesis protein [Kineosphaera limosa]NYE01628.1 putative PhzF superfamily epimerase YddE/YHI9 [Kineosphaera limosa]GAB97297.1 phenazine biosynthesis PhzC/PhzF family protein [Kineosphaera limosa NBRC 100340]